MIKYVIAAVVAFAAIGPAHAQMVTGQNPTSVVNAMIAAGYKAELTKDDTGDPLIKSASSGSSFSIFFYGCTKNIDCRTVQFYAGYTVESPKPTVEKMNEWNSKKRFVRAYLSDKGSPRVEMDLDLDDGGMSKALFDDNVEFWVLQMAEFEKHIGY